MSLGKIRFFSINPFCKSFYFDKPLIVSRYLLSVVIVGNFSVNESTRGMIVFSKFKVVCIKLF